MRIEGEFSVDAEPSEVWSVILDPDTLCRLAESCEEARRLDDTHYAGIMRVKLPFISLRAHVRGHITQMRAPTWMVVELEGETEGLPGTFRGMLELKLRQVGAGSYGRYSFEMDLLGKLGALGQPFLAKAAARLAESFSVKVSRHVRETRQGLRAKS